MKTAHLLKRLFDFRKLVSIAVLLLTLGFLANCATSTETKTIAVNQPNVKDPKILANTTAAPPVNSSGKDEPKPSESSRTPAVTYCDLVKNAAAYDKKIVRVRAIYFSGFEKIYLYDNRCETDQPPSAPEEVPAETWAQRDESFVSKGDSAEAKVNRQLDGFGRKEVTVIGRFYSTDERGDASAPNRFGHMNCCRFQFSIMRVENVANSGEKTGEDTHDYGTRIKFALYKKLALADFTIEYAGDFEAFRVAPHAPKEQLPKHSFRISRAGETLVVWEDNAEINKPLEFEFGGKKYQLESGINDQSGRLAKDELIVRKMN